MRLSPLSFNLNKQVKKNNQQKHVTNNINFGMAKLDEVQFSIAQEQYYRQAREDYIGHIWTFHPKDEQYVPRLGSIKADKEYFIDNCPAEEMKEMLSAKKYGINKDQNFYQAVNLAGYYNLAAEDRHLILDEIYRFPVLKEGEQRKTVLSELAAADIKEFWKFLDHGFENYDLQAREKILKADTYLWDTLDDKNKHRILNYMTEATGLKLVTQEMEKLPEAKPDKDQSSILTAFAKIDTRDVIKWFNAVDEKTRLKWMKKDNVFVKKIRIHEVIELVKLVGVEEFDKIYSKKYGRLFDKFFDNPRDKEAAIRCFGIDDYKEQYEQEYGDWEKIKYDLFLHQARRIEGVLRELETERFKELEVQYQVDFIIKMLNGEIKPYSQGMYGLASTYNYNGAQIIEIFEDYATNNEKVSIEDSIKILECLLKLYNETIECCKSEGPRYKTTINYCQDRIIFVQIALETLKAQMQ